MSWEITTPKIKINVSGVEKKVLETRDPETVKNEIRAIAREVGLAKFDVFVNGKLATPETFDEVFNEQIEKGDVVVDIVRVDKSA